MQLCGRLNILWHCLSLGLEWKLTFSSPVASAEFSKFTGILSAAVSQHHLLGFEITLLEFHHLHQLFLQWCFLRLTWLRIPGCLALGEWSHHHGYLGHWDLFLYSSVYSCHLFLISFASVKSIPLLSFIVPIFASSLGISNFLEDISSLSSISLHWSPRKAFLSLLAILCNSAFRGLYPSFFPLPLVSLLFSAICKASLDNHFAFLYFFLLGMFSFTAVYTMSWTSTHSSSGTLSDLIPWIYLPLPLYSHRGFDLGHTWMV